MTGKAPQSLQLHSASDLNNNCDKCIIIILLYVKILVDLHENRFLRCKPL